MKMIGGLKLDLLNLTDEEQKPIEENFALINVAIKKALLNQLDFTDTEESLSPIFCERADGFIPSLHNKGGYEVDALILSMETALENCSDEIAKEKISKMIDQGHESVLIDLFTLKKDELKEKQILSISEVKEYLNHAESEDKLTEAYESAHSAYIEDEAVKFSLRIMFHGFDGANYSFTIDSSINWEFPYFRDGKGFSAYKEVELEISDLSKIDESFATALLEVKSLFKA